MTVFSMESLLRDMVGLWIRTVSLTEKRHHIDKVPNSRHNCLVLPLCLSMGETSTDFRLWVQEQRRMIRQLDLIWVLNTSGHYHLWPAIYIKPIYHSVCPCCFILQTALSPYQTEGNTFAYLLFSSCFKYINFRNIFIYQLLLLFIFSRGIKLK